MFFLSKGPHRPEQEKKWLCGTIWKQKACAFYSWKSSSRTFVLHALLSSFRNMEASKRVRCLPKIFDEETSFCMILIYVFDSSALLPYDGHGAVGVLQQIVYVKHASINGVKNVRTKEQKQQNFSFWNIGIRERSPCFVLDFDKNRSWPESRCSNGSTLFSSIKTMELCEAVEIETNVGMTRKFFLWTNCTFHSIRL